VESHRQMEDQAAAFLAERDAGEWTHEQQAQLEHWLGASTARRVAFLRLEAVWEEARRLEALSAGLPSGVVPRPGELRNTPFFDSNMTQSLQARFPEPPGSTPSRPDSRGPRQRPRVRHFALAASILLALGLGAYFSSSPKGDRYSTPIGGGFETVPLRGGSKIILSTATQVRVELSPKERHIRLDEGEAFFEVAHDPARPFIVQVGSKRVIAVGTKFSVRRQGNDLRVIVTEGKLRAETGSARGEAAGRGVATHERSVAETTALTRASGSGEAFLTPGNVASVGDDGIVIEEKTHRSTGRSHLASRPTTHTAS